MDYFSGRACVLAWLVFMCNVLWIFFPQSLCFGVACVCVNAFHTGLLSADQAVKCIHKIQNMAGKHLEVGFTKKNQQWFSVASFVYMPKQNGLWQ